MRVFKRLNDNESFIVYTFTKSNVSLNEHGGNVENCVSSSVFTANNMEKIKLHLNKCFPVGLML